MKKSTRVIFLFISLTVVAFGQKPKSQEEVDMLLAIQNAVDPAAQVDAVHALLITFKNTEFKEWANLVAMTAYSKLNDFENMLLYGEETLKHNPENVDVLTILAYAIGTRTKEFDFDKEEKLTKAEDFARRALRVIPTMEKPNPDMLDEDWLKLTNNLTSNAHDALGLSAFLRKDYAAAEQAFKTSIAAASTENPTTFYHLARTLRATSRNDEAMELVDKSIALGGVMVGDSDLAKTLKANLIKDKARAMFNFGSKPTPKPKPSATETPVE
tara:strand:+ start:1424 stop:2236 length:813 start_codon:yes stop_codon:yes gene_type:complete